MEPAATPAEARDLVCNPDPAAKLGPPSAALRERMESADIETLSHWCGRVLTADSLDDIFGEPH